jgi:hypothetical protein
MISGQQTSLGYLQARVAEEETRHLPDSELLGRFARHHDEAAFATLVRRHGPMVLRLCQRLLRHSHDAEDVFQATFFVLARKAGCGVAGSWSFTTLKEGKYRMAIEYSNSDPKQGDVSLWVGKATTAEVELEIVPQK